MHKSLICIVLAVLSFGAARQGYAAPKPISYTELGDTPWQPVDPRATNPKVIYGADDRLDTYQVSDQQLLDWAAASCALMTATRIINNGNGTYTINPSIYTISGFPPCVGEPFADQPVAAFCSGAWLGGDLVSTAGHCFSVGDVNNVFFVFGFTMQDAITPNLLIPANQVYIGVELIDRQLNGATGADYSIIRVDRTVNMPGVSPIEIRRSGEVAPGELVGVIGHPSGLPQKIAFGANTAVRTNNTPAFFVANLDTYGGNSGSPVFNPVTGQMEGILVRGETDFVINQGGGCFQSNVVADNGGRGEDCTKTLLFASLIPETISSRGSLLLDREAYACTSQITVELRDSDLAGLGTAQVQVTSSSGDVETLAMSEDAQLAGLFSGIITLAAGVAQSGNGALNVTDGDTATVAYTDANYGGAGVVVVEEQAAIDCQAPTILNAQVTGLASGIAIFNVETDENTLATIRYGAGCGALIFTQENLVPSANHTVSSGCLTANTTYHYQVTVSDAAGNTALAPVAGCNTFMTPASTSDYHTQRFQAVPGFDLNGKSLTYYPGINGLDYIACMDSITVYPTDPPGATVLSLTDDDAVQYTLSGGAPDLLHFGVAYRSFYVNSNGNITFALPDAVTFQETIAAHFALPRISLFFDDFNPQSGGTISVKELADRVAVTYDQVVPFGGANLNSFQVELFFDGRIRISYPSITTQFGLVGLSRGGGTPCDFSESDLSATMDCSGNNDADSLSNGEELDLGTNPFDEDTDGDLLPDDYEVDNMLDPLSAVGVDGANGDKDGDGLTNLEEYNLGTEANNPDSDNDQLPDGWEFITGLDPADDTGDYGTNGDPDMDNLSNLQEYQMGTLPLVKDSDGDGLDDDVDPFPDGSDEPHSADQNANWSISLSELLRVVQLFNLGEFSCDAGSEDGYTPGTGDQSCTPHTGDYSAQDWNLNLLEMLRMIQLFNSFQYTRDLLSEDGYAPNPPAL